MDGDNIVTTDNFMLIELGFMELRFMLRQLNVATKPAQVLNKKN